MTMNGKQQKVAIYARVSSQEQVTEGVSIEAQVAALRAYAKSQGWEVADEYIDGGFSGGTDERPALKRLLIDAGRRHFSIVAVCKLDRFFRNLRLLLNNLHGLEQLGIKFVSTQEGLDTSTPYGKFAVQIIGVIAEFERGRIGERVRDSRQYLVSGGRWPGGRTVYGYRWLADERRWEVVPEEAEIVRHVYDLYTNNRVGINTIVASLNKDGARTRDGAEWRYSTIRKMLIHPGYKGRHKIGIPMPPVIDEGTWQQAQQKRESARSVLAEPKGWRLQGMCFCGKCGHALKCVRKRAGEYRYYACRGRVSQRVGKCCDLPYIRADWLEQGVWEKVKEVLSNSDKLTEHVNNALVELEEKRKKLGAESLAVESKLEAVRAKEERLGIAFADGAVNENAYRSKLKQLKKDEAVLLKCRHNIDPVELGEIINLGVHIDMVKEVLNKGSILVTDSGIFGDLGGTRGPTDINGFEMTDMVVKPIEAAIGFRESVDFQEKRETMKDHQRTILQRFNVKVIVYPNRVVIKGTIPTQVLDKTDKQEEDTAPIITSAYQGKGVEFFKGAYAPLRPSGDGGENYGLFPD
jgi:site-specific DNA recombinase